MKLPIWGCLIGGILVNFGIFFFLNKWRKTTQITQNDYIPEPWLSDIIVQGIY